MSLARFFFRSLFRFLIRHGALQILVIPKVAKRPGVLDVRVELSLRD